MWLFPKNVAESINDNELADLKDYGKILFKMTDKEIEKALSAGKLEEIQ